MIVLDAAGISRRLEGLDLIEPMERAFAAYSSGLATTPPPGEMIFDHPPGEVHVKAGWYPGSPWYVVKVASGFYDNVASGLPSSDGLMMLFDRATGAPAALLLDRGRLTDFRTAAAGAVCARHLAPAVVERIGVLGAGAQAGLQVRLLQSVRPCRSVMVWGRNPERTADWAAQMAAQGYEVESAGSAAAVAADCRLIVTTTAAHSPLLHADDLRPGTHITAVGADTPDKTELAPDVFARADRIVVDSRSQTAARGEIRHALAAGTVTTDRLEELGEIVGRPFSRADQSISIAVLTGLGVQDLAAAAAVLGADKETSCST